MTTPLLLLLTAMASSAAGLWLLLRPAGTGRLAGAVALLLLATGSGYIGARLWLDGRAAAATAFTRTSPPGHFQTITPAQLPAALAAAHGQPVLLEFYADWCPSCIVWKKEVFSRADVQAAMAPLLLLQVDATELTPDVQALMAQYGIEGLPALLAFDRGGREQPSLRLLGEMAAPDFMRWIETELLPST